MKESTIIIQGINNPLALYYAEKMLKAGTNLVAGIAAGEDIKEPHNLPVFDLVEDAVSHIVNIDTSLIFVPAYQVLDAGLEAIASGIKKIVIVTRKIPPLDMVRLKQKAKITDTIILGPGSSGIIIPNEVYLGILDQEFYQVGNIGIITTTEKFSYELSLALKKGNLGESMVITLGKDEIIGTSWEYWLQYLEKDEKTDVIVISAPLNHIHGENLAQYIKEEIKKPVISYFVGEELPLEKNFKDAGTIIANQLSYSVPNNNRYEQIINSFKQEKIPLANSPSEVRELILKMQKNNN